MDNDDMTIGHDAGSNAEDTSDERLQSKDAKNSTENSENSESCNRINPARNLCQSEELGLSCIGCCGNDIGAKDDVTEAIDRNSLEFNDFMNPLDENEIDLEGFRERIEKGVLRGCGICYNLIWKDRDRFQAICPLHPDFMNYEGEDLRADHCNPEYVCKTAHCFNDWDSAMQDKFISFIRAKGLDFHKYSIGIDDGSLLEEFSDKE